MKKHSNNTKDTCFSAFLVVFALCFALISSPFDAQAGVENDPGSKKCHGLFDGTLTKDCTASTNPDTRWNVPLVNLKIESIFKTDRYTLENGECIWNGIARFCARITGPEEYGNSDKEETKICVFEDPLDLGETDNGGGLSPFHENTPRNNALSMMEIIIAGAAAGTVIPGIGSAYGAAIGFITALVLETYNHWVLRNVGCVDIPIAVGPPVFCHRCWFNNKLPTPDIINAPDSGFFTPKVQVLMCNKTVNNTTNPSKCYKKPSSLNKISSGNADLAESISIAEQIVLEPTKNKGFKDSKQAQDGRIFEARIETQRPSKICVYLTKTADGGNSNELQGCIDRPGYMPKPSVTNEGSTNSSPTIVVKFEENGDSLTLNYDDQNSNCDTMHQSEFCAYQYCVDRSPQTGECVVKDNKICVAGYKPVPNVVVNKNTSKPISGLPNEIKSGEFLNLHSYPAIKSDSTLKYHKVDFGEDVKIYSPPFCYQRDQNNKCTNYCVIKRNSDGNPEINEQGNFVCTNENGGKCQASDDSGVCSSYVTNTTNDPYHIEFSDRMIRPMTAEEMDMCVNIPEPGTDTTTVKVYNSPGTYYYKPPARCSLVEVKAWGAGASGSNRSSDGNPATRSGGSGAFTSGILKVDSSKSYTIIVGKGGVATSTSNSETNYGSSGGYSKFTGENNSSITSGGGQTDASAAISSCSNNAYKCKSTKNGLIGSRAIGISVAGAKAYGSDGVTLVNGSTTQCKKTNYGHPATGLGGCTVDRHCDPYQGTPGNCGTSDGRVGKGGHGMVKVRCIFPDGNATPPE